LGGLVPPGFTLEEHEVILYGRCAECTIDSAESVGGR
jgi:Fe2+ or Zn2+ uptake regulation protein